MPPLRLLPGAPRWALTLPALGLLTLPGGAIGWGAAGDRPAVAVLAAALVHGGTAGALLWRARRTDSERALWQRMAAAGAVSVLAVAVSAVLDTVLTRTGSHPALPWWQLQPLLAQDAALFVIAGTALSMVFLAPWGGTCAPGWCWAPSSSSCPARR
jgi:hypothetical protein